MYVAAAAVFGKDLLINPFFGVFFVLLWVGIVPMSLLFGPFYKAISPVRTINALLARLSGSDPEVGLRDYPARLGYWPAAVGLFAFVWFELVYPFSTELGPARLWCAAYVGLMLIGGALFGNRFYENADPFEVYSSLVAHLSVWGRDDEGHLVVRSPLANLDLTPVRNGLLAVCSVLLGSTAFDSFKDSGFWVRRVQTWNVDSELAQLRGPAGVHRHRRHALRARDDGHRDPRRPPPAQPAGAVRALPAADRRRATSSRTTSATSSRSASRR